MVCGHRGAPAEQAEVRCNVRAFAGERFPVWRCAGCGSIHSGAQVDLGRYYGGYPYGSQRLDLMLMCFYDNLLRRLRRAGLRKGQSVLDYGCGSGLLLSFLRQRGYRDLAGYDAHSAAFRDPAPLGRRYDVVVSQDVIEHVEDPIALLRRLGDLARPGGVVAVGTPNAAAVDLTRAGDFAHALHQPYHLHLLTRDALLRAAADLGFTLIRYYPKQYSNTLWPFLNQRFALYYARCFDDTLDLAFDGPRFHPRLLLPQALFLGLLGWFFSQETDVMAVFRTPA